MKSIVFEVSELSRLRWESLKPILFLPLQSRRLRWRRLPPFVQHLTRSACKQEITLAGVKIFLEGKVSACGASFTVKDFTVGAVCDEDNIGVNDFVLLLAAARHFFVLARHLLAALTRSPAAEQSGY